MIFTSAFNTAALRTNKHTLFLPLGTETGNQEKIAYGNFLNGNSEQGTEQFLERPLPDDQLGLTSGKGRFFLEIHNYLYVMYIEKCD